MSRCTLILIRFLLIYHASAASFSAGSISGLRLSNTGSALAASNGNNIFIDEFTTAGTLLQTLAAPTTCTLDAAVRNGAYVYEGRLTASVDGQLIAYTCFNVATGTSVTSATRQIVSVGTTGAFAAPVTTGIVGVGAFSSMKVYNSATGGYYHGGNGPNGLYYVPPGGGSAVTLQSTLDVVHVGIFANTLCKLSAGARIPSLLERFSTGSRIPFASQTLPPRTLAMASMLPARLERCRRQVPLATLK